MKKASFVAAFGRDLAKKWWDHPDRRTISTSDLPQLKHGRVVEAEEGVTG